MWLCQVWFCPASQSLLISQSSCLSPRSLQELPAWPATAHVSLRFVMLTTVTSVVFNPNSPRLCPAPKMVNGSLLPTCRAHSVPPLVVRKWPWLTQPHSHHSQCGHSGSAEYRVQSQEILTEILTNLSMYKLLFKGRKVYF